MPVHRTTHTKEHRHVRIGSIGDLEEDPTCVSDALKEHDIALESDKNYRVRVSWEVQAEHTGTSTCHCCDEIFFADFGAACEFVRGVSHGNLLNGQFHSKYRVKHLDKDELSMLRDSPVF